MFGDPVRVALLISSVALVCLAISGWYRKKLNGQRWVFILLGVSGCLTALSALLGLIRH